MTPPPPRLAKRNVPSHPFLNCLPDICWAIVAMVQLLLLPLPLIIPSLCCCQISQTSVLSPDFLVIGLSCFFLGFIYVLLQFLYVISYPWSIVGSVCTVLMGAISSSMLVSLLASSYIHICTGQYFIKLTTQELLSELFFIIVLGVSLKYLLLSTVCDQTYQ